MYIKNYTQAAIVGGFLSAFGWMLCTTASAANHLVPPFDVESIRQNLGKEDRRKFICDKPPAAMKDLHMETFYKKDGTASIVDKEAHAKYRKASKPASIFEIELAGMANRYVLASKPRPDIASCALDWLATWAEGDALLGDVNKNGEYTRKWLLGSIASDWMQIRDEKTLDPEKRRKVENWMREVAERVKADFSRDTDLKSRQNNHLYWAAWSVGAAGMALDDTTLFDWGVEKARQGINDIQEDGTLPLELARGQRAYLYHLFASMPLFMMANAAEKNGINLFRENNEGLRRLAELNLKNLGNPEDFERLTGKKQDLKSVGDQSDLGWVEIYRQHYKDPQADTTLAQFRPMKQSRFGGNITLLYAQTLVKAPPPKKKEKS